MHKLEDYNKSKIPISEREDALFAAVEELDHESLRLFGEVIDLGEYSNYKTNSLMERISVLCDLFHQVEKAYDYLYNVEMVSYTFADRRYQFKVILALTATLYASMVNRFFGVASFLLLMSRANDDYIRERKALDQAVARYNIAEQMKNIERTLDNCCVIFGGKVSKNHVQLNSSKEEQEMIIIANHFIRMYLSGEVTDQCIHSLPDNIKKTIQEILAKDLGQEKKSLEDLLELSIIEEEKHKAMIKIYSGEQKKD